MMEWPRLICDKRLGMERYHNPNQGSRRSDFQRDYDRLVFSSPFRRLQNKTQVFPLPGSIFVHNRLTHSLEVSSVGGSIAREVAFALKQRHAGEPWVGVLDSLDEIVSAACLAHDLGNPPFGHSGEKSISTFFSEGEGRHLKEELTPEQWADLTNFEGNANAFRLLTHQFKGRRPGGLAMTYSTLGAIVKYPYESTLAGGAGKFGFFTSEKETFEKVAREMGLIYKPDADGRARWTRHPLVYLVEAADDICYEVMDLEDAVKLKVIPTEVVIDLFLGFFDGDRRSHMLEVMDRVDDPNEKVGYLRSCVIGALVQRVAEVFTDNEEAILRGELEGSLLSRVRGLERDAYARCNDVSWDKIYRASEVVDIELAGNRIITFLLEKLIHAVRFPELNYSRLLLSKVPSQYDVNAPTLFGKIQAALDHISGMTDVYALDLYRKLNGMSLPAV